MSPLLVLLLVLLLLLLLRLRGRKRRDGEPPLITGWIPFIGRALEFGRDPHTFLEEQRKMFGDIFTVQIAGKYMTFIMDPLHYPSVIRHGRQLDFHEFSRKVAASTFGYSPITEKSPILLEQITQSFRLLQGDNLSALIESMMGNLMLVFRQDHLDDDGGWKSGSMFEFCNSVMFEATLLTMYGRPVSARRHSGMGMLREDFVRFDTMFPQLVAQVPIWLLGQTKVIRDKLINFFLSNKMSYWSNGSHFIKRRSELFEQYMMKDTDKAARHFSLFWASVANTVPATFWATYYLVSHREALHVVRQEILNVLRLSGVQFSSDRDVTFSRDQLEKLVYLESTINESLRLTSASMNVRVAQEDFNLRLDGKHSVAVRKGDIIALFPQSMQVDPEIYEEPQSFRFDRYAQDGQEKTDFYKNGQRLRYYLMPFGSGSTMCPGRYFAINEIKQFLCLLLLYFDLQLEEGQSRPTVDPRRAALGVLQPTTNVRFRYRLQTA